MTEEQVRKNIAFAASSTSQKELAARCGISAAYLSDIIHGKRGIPESVLKEVGIERTVTYDWVKAKPKK